MLDMGRFWGRFRVHLGMPLALKSDPDGGELADRSFFGSGVGPGGVQSSFLIVFRSIFESILELF